MVRGQRGWAEAGVQAEYEALDGMVEGSGCCGGAWSVERRVSSLEPERKRRPRKHGRKLRPSYPGKAPPICHGFRSSALEKLQRLSFELLAMCERHTPRCGSLGAENLPLGWRGTLRGAGTSTHAADHRLRAMQERRIQKPILRLGCSQSL